MSIKSRITLTFGDRKGRQVINKSIDISEAMYDDDDVIHPMRNLVLDRDYAPVETLNESLHTTSMNKYLRMYGHIGRHTPYACTFTLPGMSDRLLNNAKGLLIYNRLKDADIYEQSEYLTERIELWLKKVKRAMGSIQSKTEIPVYEVYYELTKDGLIHGHGLFYINNNYHRAVREILMEQWVKCNPAVYKISMKKKKGNNYDYAFDICNNIDKWRKYITKEQPGFYRHNVVLPSLPTPMEYIE